MKARTETEVLALLDEEFAWRRKELTAIWTDVSSGPPKSQSARLRAGTALLYAHWEGFVKAASEGYLGFVARRRLHYRQLCPGLLALALRARIVDFASGEDASAHIAFLKFVLGKMDSNASLPKLGVIKTGNNLNSQRMKTIVLTLGLDYAPFELKENLIDTQLLDWRNTIAHGRFLCPSESDFKLLYDEISALLRNFKDQIANAVTLRTYLSVREHEPSA